MPKMLKITDSFQLNPEDYKRKKHVGGGNYGGVVKYKCVDEEKRMQLQQMGLCDSKGYFVIKRPSKYEDLAVKEQRKERDRQLFKREMDTANKLYDHCAQAGELQSPPYTLQKGAILGGKDCIISCFESHGNVDECMNGLRIAKNPYADIAAVQMLSSAYYSLRSMHQSSVLHIDYSSQNMLVKKTFDEHNNPVYGARANDYGLSRQLDPNDQKKPVYREKGIEYQPKLLSHEAVAGGLLSKQSDYYAFRIAAMQILTGRWPMQDMSVMEIVALAGDKKVGTDKMLDRAYGKSDKTFALECYEEFIKSSPYHHSGNDDEAMLLNANGRFFEAVMKYNIQFCSYDNAITPEQLIRSSQMLLQIPVSDQFKKENELYKVCERFAKFNPKVKDDLVIALGLARVEFSAMTYEDNKAAAATVGDAEAEKRAKMREQFEHARAAVASDSGKGVVVRKEVLERDGYTLVVNDDDPKNSLRH
jgi:serine/threonine protein kinase